MKPVVTLMLTTFVAGMPLIGTGCVQQDRYDQLLESHRAVQEQLVQVQDERDSYRASLEAAQRQSQQYSSELGSLQGKYDTLEGDFNRMGEETDEYLRQIQALEIGPLPVDLAAALQELAGAYPDLLTFDARRGMMRFASDFTFDLGSVALRSEAQRGVEALAGVLNSAAAAPFEARLVGHTDNVRIGKPETRRQHPTNVHLSVHRAISVRDSLVAAGVDPGRIEVAGYGPYRPVVANGARGAAENRRVELFLVPMPDMPDFVPSAATADASPAAPATPEIEEPMK